MQIVFIAGQAGLGKTTVAKMIAEKAFGLGLKPVLESFAKPIKDAAADKGFTKEEFPDKYRRFCQRLGALKRSQNEDYWVDRMRRRLVEVKQEEDADISSGVKYWERVVIIDDCRYLNEIKLGTEENAFLMFLSRGRKAVKAGAWRNHESERLAKEIDNNKLSPFREMFSYILDNDIPFSELEAHVQEITPIICGLDAESNAECDCPSCRAGDFDTNALWRELLDSLDEMGGEEIDDEETE